MVNIHKYIYTQIVYKYLFLSAWLAGSRRNHLKWSADSGVPIIMTIHTRRLFTLSLVHKGLIRMASRVLSVRTLRQVEQNKLRTLWFFPWNYVLMLCSANQVSLSAISPSIGKSTQDILHSNSQVDKQIRPLKMIRRKTWLYQRLLLEKITLTSWSLFISVFIVCFKLTSFGICWSWNSICHIWDAVTGEYRSSFGWTLE